MESFFKLFFFEKENHMAILKNKTQGNYTVVSQNIMRDNNLSLTERGMLLTLLSLSDNWNLTIKGLSQILPDGKEKISKTLNSLIEKGYVTREQARGDKGKFDSITLEVHEAPTNQADHPENPSIVEFSPCPENRDTENRDTEIRDTGNQPQYNTDIVNNKGVNNNKVCKTDTLSDSEYEDLISEFGKPAVDYQIQRIKDRSYKGCYNYPTIRTWCQERVGRSSSVPGTASKKTDFCSFHQRKYDFDALEQDALNDGNWTDLSTHMESKSLTA